MNLCKDSIKFLDFIYQNQNFDYLQRKYNLYLKYKENENKIGVLGY